MSETETLPLSDLLPFSRPLPLRDGRSLPNRVLPGPMDGITEGSFVQAMSSARLVRCWFTPFLHLSNGIPRLHRLQTALKQYFDTGLPVIVQVMGIHTEIIAPAAQRIHSLGALCVDLNCGCPSPTVLQSHSGGYVLKNPAWIAETILAMKAACGSKGVSVKIRVGFDSPEELPQIAAALNQARPDFISCHFRTVREMYQPVPREERARRFTLLRRLIPDLPLFASGDIYTLQDAREMADLGMDGVLLARGLLKNPLLIREIEENREQKPLTEHDKLSLLLQIGRLSGKPEKEWGFLLQIARIMFGRTAPQIQEFVRRFLKP